MDKKRVSCHWSMKGIHDPVISEFRRRIYNKDNDVFLIVAGKRGSCKSGSSTTLGYLTDVDRYGYSRFYLDKKYFPEGFSLLPGERMPRIIYYPSQLLDMLSNFKKYPKGTCVLWDEVGVEGDARDFASKKNKLLKRTFNTVRSLNWFIILTSVTVKDFDVAFGRAAGFYMKTMGSVTLEINGKEESYARSKIYEYDVDPVTGDKKTPYLTYYDSDIGRVKKLDEFYYIKKPPIQLEAPYKRYKQLFQTKLYDKYSSELDGIEDLDIKLGAKDEFALMDIKVKEVMADLTTYYDQKKGKFSPASVQYIGETKLKSEALAKKVIDILNTKLNNKKIFIQGKRIF